MLIGIVGAPNKGKSTLFAALTLNDVDIADYPFTTINPNMGIAYATKVCVEKELGVKCKARNSLCIDGIRKIPVNVIDVAGLVEGAHSGKGMGNQFLNDLASADALILVVDASGKTDTNGNPCNGCNPKADITTIKNELVEWILSILNKHMPKISKRIDGLNALSEVLTGLKISKEQIKSVLESLSLSEVKINWSDSDAKRFAEKILEISKPMIILANKSDSKGAEEFINSLNSEFKNEKIFATSAAIELALRKADKQNLIEYMPGSKSFNILNKNATEDQLKALNYMLKFLEQKGTNVQEAIDYILFTLLENIVVYPVEDENKYTDHFGGVLPDAILMKRGSTALDLANSIHTDIGKGMLYGIDARSKRRLAKDYILKENDVIKIVTAAK